MEFNQPVTLNQLVTVAAALVACLGGMATLFSVLVLPRIMQRTREQTAAQIGEHVSAAHTPLSNMVERCATRDQVQAIKEQLDRVNRYMDAGIIKALGGQEP